jgi:hypothetical protein
MGESWNDGGGPSMLALMDWVAAPAGPEGLSRLNHASNWCAQHTGESETAVTAQSPSSLPPLTPTYPHYFELTSG